jgi:murein DD-endopeptidase MepM/ murein hydrolase activator NlpD
MTLAGVALLLLFAANIVRGWAGAGKDVHLPPLPMAPVQTEAGAPAAAVPEVAPAPGASDPEADPVWHTTVAMPYDEYFLTQGIHGESYGHLAVDIAAGKGAVIKSVINGTVTGLGYDQWGNTYIQIENNAFSVLYLHGAYTVAVGDKVLAGQQIGTESNIGYTLDMAGNLCTNRDCGYHTHLNVFDKTAGTNIDPLTIIPATYP